jgi:hypothetical protein
MKAIVYTQHGLPIDDANALVEIDLPRPQPGPRDLLVAVRARLRSASPPSWEPIHRRWRLRRAPFRR